jgi:hypothetical protein
MATKSPASIFAEKVLKQFTEVITDNVFLYIQNNEELLQDYLDAISTSKRQTVNALIGKMIAKRFEVANDIDEKGNTIRKNPQSVLIKTKYTRHSK